MMTNARSVVLVVVARSRGGTTTTSGGAVGRWTTTTTTTGRRGMSAQTTTTTTTTSNAVKQAVNQEEKKAGSVSGGKSWWNSAEFWGGMGAMAGWGMSLSAIYDATVQGPEVISLTMTPVLIAYSAMFARWAWIVKPQNLLLCSCHIANICAQANQLRRAMEYKIQNGQQQQVNEILQKAAVGGVALTGAIVAAPTVRSALSSANLGIVSRIAAADAGPFTVHFWAPMSKWLISGASFMELDRPTEKISLAQYSALTLTGFFFSRYALLVAPINYTLCSVNIALFGSSAWHLGRKINADFIQTSTTTPSSAASTTIKKEEVVSSSA